VFGFLKHKPTPEAIADELIEALRSAAGKEDAIFLFNQDSLRKLLRITVRKARGKTVDWGCLTIPIHENGFEDEDEPWYVGPEPF
jgi:hypothetical protein